MRKMFCCLLWLLLPLSLVAQSEPSLTIYNGNFAVVRERLPLDLKAGVNRVSFAGVTSQLEPESVMLRDPEGRRAVNILEQSYRGDPVSQGLLLSLYEGKTIDFAVHHQDRFEIVQGKIIRSGYTPGGGAQQQPLIEVNGKLVFALPGQPMFPGLTADTILKPTLNWSLETDKPGAFTAEIGYVTNGLTWKADYNLVAPEKGDALDLIGWVSMTNRTGKVFENARIRLMAGDVKKIQAAGGADRLYMAKAMVAAPAPAVTEKAFDDFHLYTLTRPATLHDQEVKQVEFVRATSIPAKRIYVYDGLRSRWYGGYVGDNANYGTDANTKVAVYWEFKNSQQNHLGMPLPKGRMRFYRRDTDASLQFVGENEIDHTASDETIRLTTGNAFDVVGDRLRLDYQVSTAQRWANESFQIQVRNHKKEPVEVRVVEHLYRWAGWTIQKESDKHVKIDAQTVEFRVLVPANGEKKIDYTVHYNW